ncbi:MAG: AraC family transcriptional regulator [Bacteroidota bacterium]|nr:AraC family transcriptional regulator [Bacteroidota bacterium]
MAEQIVQREYIARINKVLDYVENNLSQSFTLDELADVANFSKYHFHRIFMALTGETLFQFITRVRIERAADMLCYKLDKSIQEIAMDCGFNDASVFARNFKKRFNISASAWRENKNQYANSNLSQVLSNIKQDRLGASYYLSDENFKLFHRMKTKPTIEIKDLPEMPVAYVRSTGPYKGNSQLFEGMFAKLCGWAGPRNLLGSGTKTIIVYHDNPDITEEEKLRVSACVPVPADTAVNGEIGKMVIPAGKYAMGRFEIGTDGFQDAWGYMCADWLVNSGYQPDDRPCFELYHNDHRQHPEGKFILDICIPVKPL